MDHASTIDDPFFFYDPATGKQHKRYPRPMQYFHLMFSRIDGPGVQVMSIDNLPAELPMEASNYFGQKLYPFVQELASGKSSAVLDRATLTRDGALVHPIHKSNMTKALQHDQSNTVTTSSQTKNVLLLGSGRVAQPLVDYFLRKNNILVTIGTNQLEEGMRLGRGGPNTRVVRVNVADPNSLGEAISKSDIVIRYDCLVVPFCDSVVSCRPTFMLK